jgi:hypothetical protein
MGNPFKTYNRRWSDKPDAKDRDSLPRKTENKEVHVLYEDPILINREPEPVEEPPEPADNNGGPAAVLIGGSILALLCLWLLAPEWLGATIGNFIKQTLHLVGL